jgi:catechol 2,3-dioxygenase-like lactoylglutathione lyase family enzyme/predicted enzyme related to lactoylglutathione lyase
MKTADVATKGLVIGLAMISGTLMSTSVRAQHETVAPVNRQPSMNVFRRFAAEDPVPLFDFYSKVLGHESLTTYDVGGGTGVSTFRAGDGASQLKFTGRTPGRLYQPGGIDNATGIRLWTFYYSDQAALSQRFIEHGLAAPEFSPLGDTGQLSAIVKDPEGQLVQLIITGDPKGTTYNEIEVGLTVSNLDASRAFYRDFVGLEELEPVYDPVFKTTKYPYRHGSTTIALRFFGSDLPADTGTGGIQYVVSDVEFVDKLARERSIVIDQPLSTLQGFGLRTIWLDDPDGITNYFAQTGAPRTPRQ